MATDRPYCVTIAGFDPSGGAGIIADCKTFEQLRVQGLSVMTANTIQTEDKFIATNWTPQEIIEQQLTVLLERYAIRFFKIGLVENAAVLDAILDTIHQRVENPFIIWDPILKPTAGGNLSEQRFSDNLPNILAKISMITPNIPEYEALFGKEEPSCVASSIPVSIYLKGGHASEPGKDHLYDNDIIYPFNPRIKTSLSKHGTGCVLSSALLAHFARKFPTMKACLLAKRYLERVLISNETLLGYHSR
jgi:hydroxymethylpyrimidine/phosphomethylpyrimidine kinase